MEEFLKFLLTGNRKKTFLKYRIISCALTAAQLALAILSVVFAASLSGTAAAVCGGVASALIAACGGAAVVLRLKRDDVYFGLVTKQRECDRAERAGEELSLRESFYEKFFSTFKPERRYKSVLPCAAWSVLFFAETILSALTGAGILDGALFVCLLVAEAGLLLVISTSAFRGSHRKSVELFDIADEEIAKIKINAGMSQRAIDRDRFYVLGFIYRFQEAFLCDAYDRRDLRRIFRASVLLYALITAVALTALIVVALLSKMTEAEYFVSVLCIAVTAFALFCATAIVTDRKRAIVYNRNLSKLTQSPEDELRRKMQSAFVGLQKRSNVMFATIIIIGTLVGLVYGGVCGLVLPDVNFWQNALGFALITLLISIVMSLIVWIIMYARYRLEVRPMENTLRSRTAA